MPNKEILVVSNYWHKPGIKVSIFADRNDAPAGAIKLEIPLADFLLAVSREIKHPATLLTRAQMAAALQAATTSALEKIKESSTAAMASR